jgi:hypothetical protein
LSGFASSALAAFLPIMLTLVSQFADRDCGLSSRRVGALGLGGHLGEVRVKRGLPQEVLSVVEEARPIRELV